MFESIELREFGGVRRCKQPIRLKRFTVLIGPNDSAKTTLLTALFLFPYPWPHHLLPLIDMPKITVTGSCFFRDFLRKDFRSLVYRYSGVGEVTCVYQGRELKLEVKDTGMGTMSIKGKNGESTYVSSEKLSEILKVDVGSLMKSCLFIPESDVFRERLEAKLVMHWETVEKSGAHTRLIRKFISNVVEDRFTEVSLRRNVLVLRKEFPDGDVAYIDMNDVGDGVKRFLTSALWLEAVKPDVVLWDDLESSAHPSLIKEVIRWLDGHDWQVIASTHSIDVLHELAVVEPKDAVVVSLRKLADDTLDYRSYTIEELRQLFETGQDVRKLLV